VLLHSTCGQVLLLDGCLKAHRLISRGTSNGALILDDKSALFFLDDETESDGAILGMLSDTTRQALSSLSGVIVDGCAAWSSWILLSVEVKGPIKVLLLISQSNIAILSVDDSLCITLLQYNETDVGVAFPIFQLILSIFLLSDPPCACNGLFGSQFLVFALV
jgi:hypothetical protein